MPLGSDALVSRSSRNTVIEALVSSLGAAGAHNPADVDEPAAVLWTDREAQWQPVIPHLRRLMPQLLTLGEYEPHERCGPAIWLRCVIAGALDAPDIPAGTPPIVYLPAVGREELASAQTCPEPLRPLVELLYRGACWTRKNGREWTVGAFLESREGGLGLDVAQDPATQRSMLRALTELVATPLDALSGRRLEAKDFDGLFSDDPRRDLLRWMSDAEAVRRGWNTARWSAFTSRCRTDLDFDPEQDGPLVAAERLGGRHGRWRAIWDRFAESPALYPGIVDLLRRATPPHDLFAERSSWPQHNERAEEELRNALRDLGGKTPAAGRQRVIELETAHGERRDWAWARLGGTPLADALLHLARLAERVSNTVGGASLAEMAALYVDGAWEADAAALSAMAAVQSTADKDALRQALRTIYLPWLESAALRFQELVERDPLGGVDKPEPHREGTASDGNLRLFSDGLRFDVAQRLAARLRTGGRTVVVSTRWAALPTVTATAKPAASPVWDRIAGRVVGEDFRPDVAETGQPLTTDRFRGLLASAGYPYVAADATGDPSGRGWTEHGALDRLGHSLQEGLAARIDEQIELLRERIDALFDAGWGRIHVVTDHGWLWLPGGLPRVKLPRYLTTSQWARCAAIKDGSNIAVPTVRWRWNAQERVAVAPGISCFGVGHVYAHGGLSLQEGLIPVMRVSPGKRAATVSVVVTDVAWVGLRCRVRLSATRPGWTVGLRTRLNDAASSVGGPGPVDDSGSASMLVADDALEGTPAAVVVLDADGQVIAKQSTIIGGED